MTEKLDASLRFERIDTILRAEIANARAALDAIPDHPIDGVHEARKAIKKARSNARLIRKGDTACSKAINDAGRQASHAVGPARDADSLIELAHAEALRTDDPDAAAELRAMAHEALDEARTHDREAAAAEARAWLDAMEARTARIEIGDPDKAMAKGLARNWKRACKRLDEAEDDPGRKAMHELRKRAKDWRYNVVALKRVWPGGVKRRKTKTKKLTTLLGDIHDIDRIAGLLEDRSGDGAKAARKAVCKRRERLCEAALDLAGDPFDVNPSKAKDKLKDAA